MRAHTHSHSMLLEGTRFHLSKSVSQKQQKEKMLIQSLAFKLAYLLLSVSVMLFLVTEHEYVLDDLDIYVRWST